MEIGVRKLLIGVAIMMALSAIATLTLSFTVLEGMYRESLREKTAQVEQLQAALEGNQAHSLQQQQVNATLQEQVNGEQARMVEQLTNSGVCLLVEGQYNRCVKLDVPTGNFVVWDAGQ